MNAAIRKKLNDQSGVTILLALLFFAICAVIGSVLLTGASGVAGKLASADTADDGTVSADQKAYSLKSAEALVNDLIAGESVYYISVTENDGADKAEQTEKTLVSYDTESFTKPTGSESPDSILTMLIGTAEGTYPADSGSNSWHIASSDGTTFETTRMPLQISNSDAEKEKGFVPVYFSLTSDKTYNITASFYYSQTDPEDHPVAALTFPATKTEYPDMIRERERERKVSVTWPKAELH